MDSRLVTLQLVDIHPREATHPLEDIRLRVGIRDIQLDLIRHLQRDTQVRLLHIQERSNQSLSRTISFGVV